ncbi:hypothetical protein [Nocardioides sp. zg-1228]|uniref:hypothetical protein n=1 Tax=Nocardioides sp. zg-1228 TaxID=2763008 RepID=UPI001642A9A1|nr:hypothetical protein [Nocardioides sp. zg-1228]MBC2933407.1 hypothetical protein [Nocardioides sp. zg-1228]QSF56443.1 hypothetical protein JX575_12390 [Nocardioides sp. zg-1228]
MPARPLTRRTTVGAALAAPLVLAACDIDPPRRDAGSVDADQPPPEDSELVAGVVAALVRARSVLEAATLAVPGLTPLLAPVATAHTAQLDVLATAVADTDVPASDPPVLPAAPRRALTAVRRSEQRLLREVRRACLVAASGDLARVLASVAASTAQHSAVLADATTSPASAEAG